MARRRRSGHEVNAVTVLMDSLRDQAEYRMAKRGRYDRQLTGVMPTGSGADFHVRLEPNYFRMMELARDLDRNDPVIGQGITRFINNVLQSGMKLDAATGDEKLNAKLQALWKGWSQDPDRCDRSRRRTLHEMAETAMRATVVDGDLFVLLAPKGREDLNCVEGHRVRTPQRVRTIKPVLGVVLNEFREPLEYWITKDDVGADARIKVREVKKFKARDGKDKRKLLHLYRPERFSQTRGITSFARTKDVVFMHDDIQFATMVKAKMSACVAIIRERDIAARNAQPAKEGEVTVEPMVSGDDRLFEGINPGLDIRGAPGERVTGFSPQVPNPEFFPHAMMMLQIIAINLGLPLQVFLLDATKTNFSGWRGAVDQARIGMRQWQQWMIRSFYSPIYRWQVAKWTEAGAITIEEVAALADPLDVLAHEWTPPSWPYIEPNKDVKADSTVIRERLNSRRGVLALRGLDIDQVDRQLLDDNARLIREAMTKKAEILDDFPEETLDWRELLELGADVSTSSQAIGEPAVGAGAGAGAQAALGVDAGDEILEGITEVKELMQQAS